MAFFDSLKKLDFVRQLFGDDALPGSERHFARIAQEPTPYAQTQMYCDLVRSLVRSQEGITLVIYNKEPSLTLSGFGKAGVVSQGGLWVSKSAPGARLNEGLCLTLAMLADDKDSRSGLVVAGKMSPQMTDIHLVIEAVSRLAAIGLSVSEIEAIALAAGLPVSMQKVWEVVAHYELAIYIDGLNVVVDGWMHSFHGWSKSIRDTRYQGVSEKVTGLAKLMSYWREGRFDIYHQ